jgi:hypothetical protein
MIKLLDLIKEIATTPYSLGPAKEKKDTRFNFSNYIDYNFTTDADREYYIRFDSKWVGRDKPADQKYNWETHLTFFPTGVKTSDDTEVGGENFGKILATVIAALKKYIEDYKPEYVYWKGIIGKDEAKPSNEDSTKRQRIYNTLMDRASQSIPGYTSIKGSKQSGLLYKDDIPIKDTNSLFKYPEEPTIHNKDDAEKKVSRFNLSRSK